MQKDISLKNYTTFKIGGKAKYFFQANSKEEIIEAIKWAKAENLPLFVLGGGSNTLVNDKKFGGVVIKVQSSKFKVQSYDEDFKVIEAEAGVALGKIVGIALKEGLTGMEWAMGIPGTIGGAVYGNAGAFGKSMSDVVEEAEAVEVQSSKFKVQSFKNSECGFEYRESIFKKNKNLIILSVKIKLSVGDKVEIETKMKEYFQKKKQIQPLEYYSAGSIFKNPENNFAAELIEKAGLKGKQIGKAQISNKHSNFIVNMGNAKAKDVKKLIDLTKKTVKKKFNIDLQEEIQYLGF